MKKKTFFQVVSKMEVYRHVGYEPSNDEMMFFSDENIEKISLAASALISDYNIIFDKHVVRYLLEKNFYDFKPPQNDIFSPLVKNSPDIFTRARQITINMLVNEAQSQIISQTVNNSYNIDIIKYAGELRATPKIKVNNRTNRFQFHMNY